jgi:hypothetical protein
MTLQERSSEALDHVLAALRRADGDRVGAVAVHGSVGRGTPRPGSGIDLLVVARDGPRGR